MKKIQEIRDWLLENAVDEEGDLYLIGLDFSEFDGDVYISSMKVKNDLFQNFQIVGRNLHQAHQNVGEDFYNHKLEGDEYWEERRDCVVRRKKLKEITLEELEKMGFKLKGEK